MAKKLLALVVLLGLAAALLASAPLAAEDSWVPVGPWGGSVSSVVVNPRDPRILYAGSISGIFKSTDGGLSWVDIQGDLPSPYVQALAISPSAPETLYVAGGLDLFSYGIFHSTDGGASWQSWESGLTDWDCGCIPEALSLSVHPRNPKIAVAGLRQGLARTTDGGVTWTRIPLEQFGLRGLTFDPEQPSTVYAGSSSGVLKSTDGGVTWKTASSGLGQASVNAIALEPGKPRTLYASTSSGIFKSSDAAGTWKLAIARLISSSLAVSPAKGGVPATVWAGTASGAFRSRDGGASWVRASLGLRNQRVTALAIHPTAPRILWAASGYTRSPLSTPGLFKSVNGGDRWRISNQGIAARSIPRIAVAPGPPGVLWGLHTSGPGFWDEVWRSNDGGATWTGRSSGLNGVLHVWDLMADPQDSEVLWAATDQGAFRTIDGGVTWQLRSAGIVTPFNGKTASVYRMSLSGDSRTIWIITFLGVFRSADAGETWTSIPLPEPYRSANDLLLDPSDPDHLIFAASGSLLRSTDGGLSWTSPDLQGGYASRLARDPADPERIVAVGSRWISVSHDGGQVWTSVPVPTAFAGHSIYSLAIDPVDGSIWVGGDDIIYNLSEDGSPQAPPLEKTATQALDLAFDPRNPDILYAAVPYRGVLKHVRGD